MEKIFCTGFGGQGVMSMGMLFAYSALLNGKEVTYCPAYGPEMRGGEANCSVVISDQKIGSPLINRDATAAIFMNEPSLRKFIDNAAPGGSIFVNSSLVKDKVERDGMNVYYIPVNEIAKELGMPWLANIVMTGAVNEILKLTDTELIIEAFTKVFGASKEKFLPANRQALAEGIRFANTIPKTQGQSVHNFTITGVLQ